MDQCFCNRGSNLLDIDYKPKEHNTQEVVEEKYVSPNHEDLSYFLWRDPTSERRTSSRFVATVQK